MKHKILIIVAALIFAAGVVGSIMVLNSPKKKTVNIKRCVHNHQIQENE